MGKRQYRRDFPDGTRQYFSECMKPDDSQRYFDDMLSMDQEWEENQPLEFLFFGRERSYPNRILHRQSEDYILHYVTAGSGRFNGKRVSAGEGFLVVPGVPHCMESDSYDPWHFMWVCFRGSDAKTQMKQVGLDGEHCYFSFGFADRLEALFDDVIYREHNDCDLNTYMQGIFYIILSYHKKQYRDDCRSRGGSVGYAAAAMQYVDTHYREELRVDEIAETLHISRKYLCAVLKKEIGMSTKEYLLRRRVAVAAELLTHTSMTVSEIAKEVGYADYTQLSRLFRKQMGVSPQQFRRYSMGKDLTDV